MQGLLLAQYFVIGSFEKYGVGFIADSILGSIGAENFQLSFINRYKEGIEGLKIQPVVKRNYNGYQFTKQI